MTPLPDKPDARLASAANIRRWLEKNGVAQSSSAEDQLYRLELAVAEILSVVDEEQAAYFQSIIEEVGVYRP